MGLLDNLYRQNYKYINVFEALDMLAKNEGCNVSEIAKFLLANEYHKYSKTYKKNYFDQIQSCDDNSIGIVEVDYWTVTKDVLDKTLREGTYSEDTFSSMYEEFDYAEYFWLKEDFYNFNGFKKIGFEINDDTYERYLSFKNLAQYENELDIKQGSKFTTDDYKFFLFKKPLLTFSEASCIMTGYNPQYVEQCQNDTNFKQNFSNYLGGKGLIGSWTEANMLDYDHECRLYADEFKQFLANDGTFIDGFNDHLKNEAIDQSLDNQNLIIDQLKIENEELQQKLKNNEDEYINLAIDLKATENTLNRIVAENEKMKAGLAEKDQKIKELESLNCKKDTDLLSLIFDETKKERYSPDLVLAIKLWEYVYIVNPKDDSHSNKADTWLNANTGYEVAKKGSSASKIREITTPFLSWGNLRDKNYKK